MYGPGKAIDITHVTQRNGILRLTWEQDSDPCMASVNDISSPQWTSSDPTSFPPSPSWYIDLASLLQQLHKAMKCF